ncbi:MAG: hypothetical protein E7495_08435 [Ruminococcus flavefaciens]|jgi:hypothetical protein|nr:hypothetical protein [Ruminococcus flavefaciens]
MDNNINVEEIMSQIKREIKKKNLTADMLSFEDVPYEKPTDMSSGSSLEDCDSALTYMNTHYYIQPYKELQGNPLKVFFKKVIRKLTKFYVEPVVFEQNDFNANTTKALNSLRSAVNTGSESSDMNDRLQVLELAQKELTKRIDSLERENAALREELGKQRTE